MAPSATRPFATRPSPPRTRCPRPHHSRPRRSGTRRTRVTSREARHVDGRVVSIFSISIFHGTFVVRSMANQTRGADICEGVPKNEALPPANEPSHDDRRSSDLIYVANDDERATLYNPISASYSFLVSASSTAALKRTSAILKQKRFHAQSFVVQ